MTTHPGKVASKTPSSRGDLDYEIDALFVVVDALRVLRTREMQQRVLRCALVLLRLRQGEL